MIFPTLDVQYSQNNYASVSRPQRNAQWLVGKQDLLESQVYTPPPPHHHHHLSLFKSTLAPESLCPTFFLPFLRNELVLREFVMENLQLIVFSVPYNYSQFTKLIDIGHIALYYA